jgi:prepilin-type N-terminal cleavage/methylation domain-containing protein
MKQDGVTLIELLVVVAVGGILMIVLGFEFVGWMARYRVESQIKTLQSDLLNARQRAMEKNIQYDPVTHGGKYVICEDTNGNNICDAAETTIPSPLPFNPQISVTLSKSGLRYAMDWNNLDLGVVPNSTIIVDGRGTLPCTNPAATCTGFIFLKNPDTGNPYTSEDVDYDCILLSAVKINVGKYDATTNICTAK